MERLTGLDASFLYLETVDQPMVINGLIELDVSTMDGGFDFARLQEVLFRRIKEVPQLRRKLYDSAFNVGHPAWVEEFDLDIGDHVHHIRLPEGSDDDLLLDVCGELASRPLTRDRPLWSAWVIEGLPQPDRVAVFCRVHHSVLDGISAASLIDILANTSETHPGRSAELVRRHVGSPNAVQLILGGAASLARRPFTLASLIPETLMVPFNLSRGGRRAAGTADAAGTDREGMPTPFTAPRTLFNGTITPRRAMSFVSLDLEELKEVKNAFDTTINDVLLAVVGGALREYLIAADDLPEKPLISVVPVSTHSGENVVDSGPANQISAMFATLGTDLADPVDRLSEIARRSTRGKSQTGGVRPALLEDWASLAPRWLVNAGMRAYGTFGLADLHPVLHNLIVSNVPGPPIPLYFLGARITHLYPMGPIFHGAGLSVTGVSFDGHLDLGVISCEHLVPDPYVITEAMTATMAELVEAART